MFGPGWWSTFVLPRLTVRPKSLEALEKRSSISCRSDSVWAASAQSSAKRTSWRRLCRLFVLVARRRRSKRETVMQGITEVVWHLLLFPDTQQNIMEGFQGVGACRFVDLGRDAVLP